MQAQEKIRRTSTVRVGNVQIRQHAARHNMLVDPYHLVLTWRWPQFFSALVLAFIAMNLVFGAAYWLVPGSVANARDGYFWDYFFFSIETLATVGYGAMAPANTWGHVVASLEILVGMVGVALTTGLVFARFAKPKARIVFSERALIRQFDGKRTFMLRIANERYNRIVGASATLAMVRNETTIEGETIFRIYDLPLVRQRTQLFALTWTLMHVIDEASPLHEQSLAALASSRMRIVVSVTGHDENVSAAVHAGGEYDAGAIVMDGRFADVILVNEVGDRIVDLTRFHTIEAPTTDAKVSDAKVTGAKATETPTAEAVGSAQ